MRVPHSSLSLFAVAILISTASCVSLAVGAGAHAPASGTPTRVASGNVVLGGWYSFRDKYVLDLNLGYAVGPLGNKSNALLVTGGRFSSKSTGWRPGYYGALAVGAPFPNDQERPEAGPTGGMFRADLGVAWTTFSRERADNGPFRYGSILLGVAYYRQEQDNIGIGDFLGLELTVVGGTDVGEAIYRGTQKKDPY